MDLEFLRDRNTEWLEITLVRCVHNDDEGSNLFIVNSRVKGYKSSDSMFVALADFK